VVLCHRKVKQQEKVFSGRFIRWYKTTGIRLRQASCRTRNPQHWLCKSFNGIHISLSDLHKSLAEIPISPGDLCIWEKEIHKSFPELRISSRKTGSASLSSTVTAKCARKNPKRKRGPPSGLWHIFHENRDVGPRLRFGFFRAHLAPIPATTAFAPWQRPSKFSS